MRRPASDSQAIPSAVEVLQRGGVVAYPTETFYGLAVDPRSSDAVRRLFALKGRPETSALTLIAADLDQARRTGAFNRTAMALAARWWPGPLTMVVPALSGLAAEALAGGTTVGLRVSGSEIARDLASAFGFCVTATSANRSGEPAAANADQVAAQLPAVDFLLDGGAAPGGAPSTIVAVTGEAVSLVRAGAVAWERVLKSLESA